MAFDYNGVWYNQLDSKLEVKVGKDGRLEGSFTSIVQPDKPVPLVGYVRDDVIVFCNAFEGGCGTMLGQPLELEGATEFQTWWHFRASSDPKPAWETVRTGCDTFKRKRG